MKLILASGSPRRRHMIELFNVPVQIVPSDYVEVNDEPIPLPQLVQKLAKGKAIDVASKVDAGLVIGGDTLVAIGTQILGKPKSKEEAFAMLRRLSGSINTVYSGIAIIDAATGECRTDYERTDVTFKKLTDQEILDYIATGEPLDKAGSYGLQGIGGVFIEKIDGCYSNVIGLPLPKLYALLRQFGLNMLAGKHK